MSTARTPSQKAADALAVFNVLRDEVTPPIMRAVLNDMTDAQRQAAIASVGDVQAYAALVQASLHLQRVVAANDRMTMMAAAILTSGGVAKPVIEEEAE
jgi:hypothetical protein